MKKLQLLAILVLAGILRFYNNTAVSLWHDEAFSALYISKYGWGEMMHRIILDVHPPLYYIVLRLWSYIFSDNLLSLRALSIIFGILTVWAGYLFVKQAFKNEKWALVAALLLAVNPFQIQYALEARMYTLGTFLVLISSYLLLKALETGKLKHWIWYGITVAAGAYTHYFLLFSLVAQALYFAYHVLSTYKLGFFKQPTFLKGLMAYALSVILYLPWLPGFIEQNTRVSGGYWITAPDRWSVPGTIWKMAFGGEGINRPTLAIASAITAVLILFFIRRAQPKTKWLVFLGLTVPFAAAIGLSLRQAIYLDRYFVFASLFFSILIGLAFLHFARPMWRRVFISLLVIFSLVAFFKNWQNLDVKNMVFDRSVNKKPGMARAAELVNERALPEHKIYVGSSFIFFTFQYYNETGIKPLLLSSEPVENIPHFAGTAILTNEELQITQNGLVPAEAVEKNNNVWLIWTTGFGGSKPNVPGNWSEVQEHEFQDTPGFKGKIVVTEYHVR
jgi:mannosyltransferase